MMTRLLDFLQNEGITAMFTALSRITKINEETDEEVSSLVDAWITVRDMESNGERNRGLYVMKSRGMPHSNQVREFMITNEGLSLVDVYIGPDGVLTGSARETQQLEEQTGKVLRTHASDRKDREIDRKRMILEAKISSLQSEFESVEAELNKVYIEEDLKKEILDKSRSDMARLRGAVNSDEQSTKRKGRK